MRGLGGERPAGGASAALAALWLLLTVYASLFPFGPWRWPPGARLPDLLRLPWPHWFIPFDIVSNLLAYVPLGLLLCLALMRGPRRWPAAAAIALAGGAACSYLLESTQHLLPQRVPSLLDWVLNSGGTALGALLAGGLQALGWPAKLQRMHDRWLARGGDGAVVLLLLWPLALLFPAPVPLGLGQIGGRLREGLVELLDGVPWAARLAEALAEAAEPAPLSAAAEALTVALGLLAPCLLAYAASRPGWRRALLALGATLVATAATTLSTALNFGPDHALAWRTPLALFGLGSALALALALVWIGPRLAGGLALVALTGLVMLVHEAPTDAYFADSLQAWEQGRFIRFHGLAQWIGWLWPYAAMAWLLSRLRSDRRGGP